MDSSILIFELYICTSSDFFVLSFFFSSRLREIQKVTYHEDTDYLARVWTCVVVPLHVVWSWSVPIRSTDTGNSTSCDTSQQRSPSESSNLLQSSLQNRLLTTGLDSDQLTQEGIHLDDESSIHFFTDHSQTCPDVSVNQLWIRCLLTTSRSGDVDSITSAGTLGEGKEQKDQTKELDFQPRDPASEAIRKSQTSSRTPLCVSPRP